MLKSRVVYANSAQKLEEQLNEFLRIEGIGSACPLVDLKYQHGTSGQGDFWWQRFSVLVLYSVPDSGIGRRPA